MFPPCWRLVPANPGQIVHNSQDMQGTKVRARRGLAFWSKNRVRRRRLGCVWGYALWRQPGMSYWEKPWLAGGPPGPRLQPIYLGWTETGALTPQTQKDKEFKPAWQSLGESNPSLQVENLAS